MTAPVSATLDTLARTLWGEARGEGRAGMEAVAAVIMNRARRPRWWGKDVQGVCLKPFQFSCWLPNDPNCAKLKAVTGADRDFVTALAVAQAAVDGKLPDPTGGADSYADLRVCSPGWAKAGKRLCQIGHHTFFRVEP